MLLVRVGRPVMLMQALVCIEHIFERRHPTGKRNHTLCTESSLAI
jgi:hypothetical protein